MGHIYFYDDVPAVNPFREDGLYDNSWVQLAITKSSDYQMMTCKTYIFQFKVSKHCDGWQFRAMDYISYQMEYNRNVIVTASQENYEEAQTAYRGHSRHDPFLRYYEPEFLVHSTPPHAVQHILQEGVLKSWNKVKAVNHIAEEKPIGSKLGDPRDFSDYVMLGEGVAPEVVVSSREKGFICMNADCEYMPGARFYFDTTELLAKGLLTRDGCHYKVKDELPIDMALFCADGRTVDMQGQRITPQSFARAADEAFERFGEGRLSKRRKL